MFIIVRIFFFSEFSKIEYTKNYYIFICLEKFQKRQIAFKKFLSIEFATVEYDIQFII